jgi:hypothetical protein
MYQKRGKSKLKITYIPIKSPDNFMRVHLALKKLFNEEDIINYFEKQNSETNKIIKNKN